MEFIKKPFERFFKQETSSSVLLFVLTLLALIIANSGLSDSYYEFFHKKFTIGFGDFLISKSLILWINDGLMAIFFFVIGLELKRELMQGELSSVKKASLPFFAAVGGMIVPALLFKLLNTDPAFDQGWAIPIAADIAFTLGILKLLGNRVPYGLKVFITAFAIIDDFGAILIIAIFYTSSIKINLVLIALGIVVLLGIMTYLKMYSKYLYFIAGAVVWFLLLKSGVHATIAGVLIAMTIPLKQKVKLSDSYKKINEAMVIIRKRVDKDESPVLLNKSEMGAIDTIENQADSLQSPLQRLENRLHAWVVFFIMPIFAFANAGVLINSDNFTQLSLIVIITMVLGNFTGIGLFSYVALKLKLAHLPENVKTSQIIAIGILGGLGFTMSLFITNLAYEQQAIIDSAKVGILIGSLLAASLGYFALKWTLKN